MYCVLLFIFKNPCPSNIGILSCTDWIMQCNIYIFTIAYTQCWNVTYLPRSLWILYCGLLYHKMLLFRLCVLKMYWGKNLDGSNNLYVCIRLDHTNHIRCPMHCLAMLLFCIPNVCEPLQCLVTASELLGLCAFSYAGLHISLPKFIAGLYIYQTHLTVLGLP